MHSAWHRGTNEKTNGLHRQESPPGTEFYLTTEAHLDAVAAGLNGRLRQALDRYGPAEVMGCLLSESESTVVATTVESAYRSRLLVLTKCGPPG